jgi:hypothetical protein
VTTSSEPGRPTPHHDEAAGYDRYQSDRVGTADYYNVQLDALKRTEKWSAYRRLALVCAANGHRVAEVIDTRPQPCLLYHALESQAASPAGLPPRPSGPALRRSPRRRIRLLNAGSGEPDDQPDQDSSAILTPCGCHLWEIPLAGVYRALAEGQRKITMRT